MAGRGGEIMMTTPPRLPRSRRLWVGDAFPAGHKLHSRRASLRSYHPDTIRSRGSRRRTGACDLKEHPSPPAATVLGRLRPGPTSPGWPLLSARSVWLFWAGCVSPSGCRDCFASSPPRSSTSAWDEARGPPVQCTSLGTRVGICWRLIGIEPYLSRSTVWRPREIAEFSPSNRGRAQGAPATPPDGS